MQLDELLRTLFLEGHEVRREGDVVSGHGVLDDQVIAVVGTTAHAAIGVEIALVLAREVLAVVRNHPARPLLLLVDTQGQRLNRRDELLGLNGYLAHLTKCLMLARQQGHPLLSVVYGEGVSGGFLSFGLMADKVYALPEAQVRVMNLSAMARVAKIPLERLQALSASSPVFAPGVDNFFKLGGLDGIWEHNLAACLRSALARPVKSAADRTRAPGNQLRQTIVQRVREDTPHVRN